MAKHYYPIVFLLVCLCFGSDLKAQSVIDWNKLSPHPRLMLKAGEEQKIRQEINTVPELKKIHEKIMANADSFMIQPTVYYHKEGKRLLQVSRDAFLVLHDLAYAYRMTHDINYAKRAEQELRTVTQFPDWNPSHFLDVGEMSMGVSIAYDWLYDQLTPGTKKMVEQALYKFAFTPALPKYLPEMKKDVDNWFYGANNNWNQVCNAGLGMAALAVHEAFPQASDSILKLALKTLHLTLNEYAPDGAYPEGFGYWDYGTGFQAMLNTSLETSLGTDFNLSAYPGFLKTASYRIQMMGPSLKAFGYSDGGANAIEASSAMFYFAAKNHDPSLLYNELKLIRQNRISSTLLPSYLVYVKDLPITKIHAPEQTFWYGKGKTPVVLIHSNWNDPASIFLGIKGGCAQTSHAHLDAGSFVYESNGVRWATDLPQDSYYRLESAGIDLWNQEDGSQRWTLLRQNNRYHNTLTVNGKPHLATAFAPIKNVFNTSRKKGASLDLTPLFRGDLKKAIRRICLIDGHYLQLSDYIQGGNTSSEIQWTMVTETNPKIVSPNKVVLSKDGKTAELILDAPQHASWEIWDNKPTNAVETPNKNTCRIGFKLLIKKNQTAYIKVRLITK